MEAIERFHFRIDNALKELLKDFELKEAQYRALKAVLIKKNDIVWQFNLRATENL